MDGDEVRFFKEEKELCNEHGMTFVMESIEDMGALREDEEEELEGNREGKEQDGRERERNESGKRKREREWKKRDTQLGG